MSEVTVSGLLDHTVAQALAGILETDEPAAELPPLWHCAFLLDRPRQSDLGPDGHPFRNAVPLPPRVGLRRMFAGGRVDVSQPLHLGAATVRRTSLARQETKEGRSGTLNFVTVAHEYLQDGVVAVRDEQDLVYRDPAPASTAGTTPTAVEPAVAVGPGERKIDVDPTLLFRFSALTYNAHRIHYDRDFATRDEGYPGLLVHGPLQSLLMAEQAGVTAPIVAPYRFSYRLESPLFDNQGLVVGARAGTEGIETWVRDSGGRRTASGVVERGTA